MTRTVLRTRWGAVLACALSWSCASGGPSAASGPGGRCTSDLAPADESLTEVLDSVGVQQSLESLWPASAGLAVARVADDPEVPQPISVWSESLTEEQRHAVAETLAEHHLEGADTRAYLFLGDENGPAIRRVDRLGQCAPTLISRDPIARRIAAEARGLGIDQTYVVRLYTFVERSGQISEVRIAESSGDARVDLAAARVFRDERMTPGMVEGMRVPLWVAFPVTFRPRR